MVRSSRAEALDDQWDAVQSRIELDGSRFAPEALAGLDAFSHLVVVYPFHKTDPAKTESRAPSARQYRLAQGGHLRPARQGPANHLGICTCGILKVHGLTVEVQGLDAIDGSPVLDLKPYMQGFEPRASIREPEWAREIMKEYW